MAISIPYSRYYIGLEIKLFEIESKLISHNSLFARLGRAHGADLASTEELENKMMQFAATHSR